MFHNTNPLTAKYFLSNLEEVFTPNKYQNISQQLTIILSLSKNTNFSLKDQSTYGQLYFSKMTPSLKILEKKVS